MAYIYQITNDVNNKIYIGKTEFDIQKRFKEHCQDAFRERNEKRPLYAAMRKYGTEHFHIELLEETDNPEEREMYWIEVTGSFKNGYNATIGGEGKKYLDYELIYKLYSNGLSQAEISKQLKCDKTSVKKVLALHQIPIEEKVMRSINSLKKSVAKLHPETEEIIEIYETVNEAEKHNGNTRHIADVCLGRRKTCKGFKWKYI